MDTRTIVYDFAGHLVIPATASSDGSPWVKADTSSAGAPTVASAAGGGVALTLAADDEVENLCLYHGDILSFALANLLRARFWVALSADIAAAASAAFGLCSARNDAIDSLANHASFRVLGSAGGGNALTVESDDGTTDKDDITTGQVVNATLRRYEIDFSQGLSKVQFFGQNTRGDLRRVAAGTTFDMSAAAANSVQPYAQIQKTGGATVPALTVRRIELDVRGF